MLRPCPYIPFTRPVSLIRSVPTLDPGNIGAVSPYAVDFILSRSVIHWPCKLHWKSIKLQVTRWHKRVRLELSNLIGQSIKISLHFQFRRTSYSQMGNCMTRWSKYFCHTHHEFFTQRVGILRMGIRDTQNLKQTPSYIGRQLWRKRVCIYIKPVISAYRQGNIVVRRKVV